MNSGCTGLHGLVARACANAECAEPGPVADERASLFQERVGVRRSLMSATALAAFMLAAPFVPAAAQGISAYSGNTITTGADITADSIGAHAYPGGIIKLTGGTITITGTGAGKKFGLQAEGTGTIESAANIVMAGADQWYAVYALNGGTIVLSGGTITSTENGVRGLYTSGAGSNISGAININMVGSNAYGADIQRGGSLTLTGGTITTSGSYGIGVVVFPEATAKLTNVIINTSGNNSIGAESYGEMHLIGGSVTVNNTLGRGLFAGSNGTITSSTVVNTTGTEGYGAIAMNTGVITLEGGSITTIGERAFGAAVTNGGTVNANGGTISTSGTNASGLYARDAGSTINTIINITTTGETANGAHAAITGKVNLKAGLVKTTGQGSHGAVASAGGSVNLAGAVVATTGDASFGLLSTGSGSNVNGAISVTTAGAGAHVAAVASGGYLELADSLLTATGVGAAGLYMSDVVATGTTGSAVLNRVTLASPQGASMMADGGASSIAFTDSTAVNNNGTWLHVASSDLANPAILTVAIDQSSIKGVATTDAASASHVTLSGASEWELTGNSSLTSLIHDNSTIAFSAPVGDPTQAAGYKTLTVRDYVGNGGTLVLNTYLGDDSSPSDKLVITGSATGQTFLSVINTGGLGSMTNGNGILVVEAVGAATTATGAFQLAHRVAAGAYNYNLSRGGRGGATPDSWYLSASVPVTDPGINIVAPAEPPPTPATPAEPVETQEVRAIEVPDYRVEVPLMASVMPMAMEYGYAMLGTLHERVGDTWNAPVLPAYEEKLVRGKNGKQAVVRVPVGKTAEQNPWFSGAWGRLIGDRGFRNHNHNFERRGPDYDYTFTGIQTGLDVYAREQSDGTLDKLGIYVGYGQIDGNVKGAWAGKAGTIDMDAYTVGAYWTHKAAQGWYTDAVVQGTWYSSDARSIDGQQLKQDGFGILASLEAGYALQLGNGFTLEPQAQLVYQNVSFDDVSDAYGRFNLSDGESLRGRLGMRLTRTFNMADAVRPRMLTTWLRANVWHEFMGGTRTTASTLTGSNPYTVHASLGGTWAEIGAGVSGQVSDNVALFATAAYNRSLDNRGREAWNGRLGVTVKW